MSFLFFSLILSISVATAHSTPSETPCDLQLLTVNPDFVKSLPGALILGLVVLNPSKGT